jgi:hypothetical protein
VFVESTCDFTCSVLAGAMGNLASTYFALGRHQDALVMEEKTLEFQRRVLPENHPSIGASCFNISFSYGQAGNFHLAMERALEALRIWKTALPPSHPNIEQAQQLVLKIQGTIARRA